MHLQRDISSDQTELPFVFDWTHKITMSSTDGDAEPEDTQKEEEEEEHEWSAFYDDEGRIYYYNNVSGESSWEAPEKFNPPPEAPPAAAEQATATDATATEAEPSTPTAADSSSAWVAYQDDEGREYYFNTVTEETTWEKPDGFVASALETTTAEPQEEEEEDGGVSPERPSSPLEMDEPPPTPEPSGEDEDDDQERVEPKKEQASPELEPEEDQVDPAVKQLEEAWAALNQTDAIMEPGVLAHVAVVVNSEGGNGQKAIEALSESYFGETAACGLMGRWLAELKSQSATSDSAEQTKAFSDAAEEIRDMVQDVVNRITNERFTKAGGDSLLKLSKKEAYFLTEMMESSRWRKLLIDLSASNKDSALLMYCLEQISKRGHHREIARRINQSDHFTVFNAMLASELSVIGKIAVSACRGSDTAISLSELVGDLTRTCTSTAYTYIYALEVLRQLVVTAKQKVSSDPDFQIPVFARAIRKWERLNEDLQTSIVDPAAAAGSTPLFRKRRLDVAVTISDLHQRQRRRIVPSEDGAPASKLVDSDDRRSMVETAVLEFLRRYSLGTRVDDGILDKMLPGGLSGDPSNLVGKLMIKRPLTVKALLGYMYKPGSQRVASVTIKNKCARLVALAVHAAEDEALAEARNMKASIEPERDEVALTRMLLEGSRLCETLENMVSFIVVASSDTKVLAESPGQQLCSLAVKCAPVAQGVAIWAREITKGSEFVTSASYPTLSPSILSLVRVVFLKHPFVRDDAIEVAISFLKHSNSEISYQKMNEIKEQSLRLLLFLCIRGEAPTVLGQIITLLTGTTHLDASLVRYFVSGLLEIAKAPFSMPFVRLLCTLLNVPSTVEAVKTTYFEDSSKKQLQRVIRYLGDLGTNGTHGKLGPEDVSLLKSVVSTYDS